MQSNITVGQNEVKLCDWSWSEWFWLLEEKELENEEDYKEMLSLMWFHHKA
jgi:hypothetical protein